MVLEGICNTKVEDGSHPLKKILKCKVISSNDVSKDQIIVTYTLVINI